MELNITKFFNENCAKDYSASVIEIGNNAGAATWQAACDDSAEYMILDTDEKREAFRAHVKGFGAWDDSEIAACSDVELNALLIQMIAGDIREMQRYCGNDWDAYMSQDCPVGGSLSKSWGGGVYYYID